MWYLLSPMKESESEVAQSCPTLCNSMNCSVPCSSIHGIFQARILEWVAVSFSRGSSWPRDRTWVSHIAGRLCTTCATRKVLLSLINEQNISQDKDLIKPFPRNQNSFKVGLFGMKKNKTTEKRKKKKRKNIDCVQTEK